MQPFVGSTTGLQALFPVLPGHSKGKEGPLAGPTDLLVCSHHFLHTTVLTHSFPVLCQESTKSMYSSRVSLRVLMPWCVVAYPWEGILVFCSPLLVAALALWLQRAQCRQHCTSGVVFAENRAARLSVVVAHPQARQASVFPQVRKASKCLMG